MGTSVKLNTSVIFTINACWISLQLAVTWPSFECSCIVSENCVSTRLCLPCDYLNNPTAFAGSLTPYGGSSFVNLSSTASMSSTRPDDAGTYRLFRLSDLNDDCYRQELLSIDQRDMNKLWEKSDSVELLVSLRFQCLLSLYVMVVDLLVSHFA